MFMNVLICMDASWIYESSNNNMGNNMGNKCCKETTLVENIYVYVCIHNLPICVSVFISEGGVVNSGVEVMRTASIICSSN